MFNSDLLETIISTNQQINAIFRPSGIMSVNNEHDSVLEVTAQAQNHFKQQFITACRLKLNHVERKQDKHDPETMVTSLNLVQM